MTEKEKTKKVKENKSKPTISVSFPHGEIRDECMLKLKSIISEFRYRPGTKVESQSGLIRQMLMNGKFETDEDGNVFMKFLVLENE